MPRQGSQLSLWAAGAVLILTSCEPDRPVSIGTTPALGAAIQENNARRERELRNIVPGDYIVHVKKQVQNVAAESENLARKYGGIVSSVWSGGRLHGFVLLNMPRTKYKLLMREPAVRYAEAVRQLGSLGVQQLPSTLFLSGGYLSNPLWHLDRIDHSGAAVYDTTYDYGEAGNRGSGVRLYIVDSGVRGGHDEFTGRILSGHCKYSYRLGGVTWHNVSCSETIDSYDHGTAVASVAAGDSLGVAKEAYIVPVRVQSDDKARCDDVADGLDWVRRHFVSPGVVNVSLGGKNCRAAKYALEAMVILDIPVVKAAGDTLVSAAYDNANSVSGVVVVGGTNRQDSIWIADSNGLQGSSYGSLVQISAPASLLAVASSADNSAIVAKQGVSFSAAAVSGVIARMLELKPGMSSTEIHYHLYGQASNVTIGGASGTASRMLYSGVNPNGGTTPSNPPSAPTITVSIDGYNTVQPEAACYFFANASGGNSSDYSYVWTVNGEEVGDDDDVLHYANNGTSFTVAVQVFDGDTHGNAELEVSVSEEAGECLVYELRLNASPWSGR